MAVFSCWTNAHTTSASVLENDLSKALGDGASGAWINEDPGYSPQLMDPVVYQLIG